MSGYDRKSYDLGYTYYTASNKNEFIRVMDDFVNPVIAKSIILEVFTDYEDESKAVDIMRNIEISALNSTKAFAKKIIGQNNITKIKAIIQK